MVSEPFGIRMGAPVTDYEILEELREGKYRVSPPRAHPLMAGYILQASKMSGVVWIKGYSEIIENDNYGQSIRLLVDRIAGQLTQKYGSGKKTDTLLYGSIWNEPKEWMNALGANERIYAHSWEGRDLKSKADDLESIFVGATGVSHVAGMVALEYASIDMKRASTELDGEMADLL